MSAVEDPLPLVVEVPELDPRAVGTGGSGGPDHEELPDHLTTLENGHPGLSRDISGGSLAGIG